MKTLAIIPAKGCSTRLPGKNLLPLGGLPLFLHSAYYARQEGAEPLVASDSQEVLRLAEEHGVRTFALELPPGGDAPMDDTLRAVVEEAGRGEYGAFALLQPTSPLREPGLLRGLLRRLAAAAAEGAYYTAPKVKPQGHFGGLYMQGYRAQDTRAWMWPFDGSVIVFTRGHWQRWGSCLSPEAVPVEHPAPACLQVDTAEDFTLLAALADSPPYRHLLPGRMGLQVAVISNAPDSPTDYTSLIHEMDEVWRVNRLENWGSSFTGTRTDAALLTIGPCFLAHAPASRGDAALQASPHARLWYAAPWEQLAKRHAAALGLELWAPAPDAYPAPSRASTTAGRAVALARWLHPGAHIHFIGTLSAAVRTHGMPYHTRSGESEWLESLAAAGELTEHPT